MNCQALISHQDAANPLHRKSVKECKKCNPPTYDSAGQPIHCPVDETPSAGCGAMGGSAAE